MVPPAVRTALALAVAAASLCATSAPAAAKAAKPVAKAASAPAAPCNAHRRYPYVGAVTADAKTGRVLFAESAEAEAYPASLTKLMTALLVLEDVATNRYALSDLVEATPEVYDSEASWVGLKVGQKLPVDELLTWLLVHSANDAAIALGVHASGSLSAFVERMNRRAAELGMANTRYFNPNGLPPGGPPKSNRRYPWKDFNRTTAADQLKLALEVVKHPEIFRYTSQKVANVRDGKGRELTVKNHNRILRMDKYHVTNPDGSEAVDGLKTGYIKAGGYSIILTGTRGAERAVVVVLGCGEKLDGRGKVLKPSSDVREEEASRLLRDALDSLTW